MLRRRDFIAASSLGLVPAGLRGLVGLDTLAGRAEPSPGRIADAPSSFPGQEPALVREIVAVSHGNLERVRELVTECPELAKAGVDWGFGDWETALGAASHTGRREIALLLLGNGARPTLFSAAMLGQLEVVRAMVEASPGVQRTLGPHGFTLLAHARLGGEHATDVCDYLEGLGDADDGPRSLPLEEAWRTSALGTYRYGDGDDEVLDVTDRDGALFIGRPGHFARGLTHLGDLRFHPAGAPSVRISFRAAPGPPAEIEIVAGAVRLTGRRVG